MPLTRATVTIASRVMLPVYPALALYIGFIYATDPGGRLRGSPVFPFLPTALWGAGFLVAGTLLAVALITRIRSFYALMLAPLVLWFAVWSAALVVSAVVDGTSFSAPAFPAFGAAACVATMLSLMSRETT